MSSPRMKIRCPNCQKDGSARAELVNRRVSCKHCSHVFRALPVDEVVAASIPRTELLPLQPTDPTPASAPARRSRERVEALEREIRSLRDDLSSGQATASPLETLRGQLARALDAAREAEAREQSLRKEVDRLRDQFDQTIPMTVDGSKDGLREEELRFLRDQLDKARAEAGSETRKRRDASALHAAREAEHAQVLASKEAEHAELARGLSEQLDRVRADESARTEAEDRMTSERIALRDELSRVQAELEAANHAIDDLRIDRDRLQSDHARAVEDLRNQLDGEREAHRSRLLEADRAIGEHHQAAEGLRLDRGRLEAKQSAELAGLREELESARAGLVDVELARRERDEALIQRDRIVEELDTLRSKLAEADRSGTDWGYHSTEMEVSQPGTEADIPTLPHEMATIFDGGPERFGLGLDRSKAEAQSLRIALEEATHLLAQRENELEEVRAKAGAASLENRELIDRLRALRADLSPVPTDPSSVTDPTSIELARRRTIDEAVKGAWADFERRLAETQAKLQAANARAELMETEAREAREQVAAHERGLDLSDGSSFGEVSSMTSIRILADRGTARITPADAEARLAMAKQVAVDRKDKALIDRIGKMAEKVRTDLDARNYTLAETLVRGAEIETGLDPGGFSISGLRIFRASPTVAGSLAALAPAFDRVIRQGDLDSIRSTIDEMRTILGDQAGLPEIRRIGRTPAIKRPITEDEAVRLFLNALEAENWLMRPIAAKKSLPDTSLTTYACLIEACSAARLSAERHDPGRVEMLDSVIQASCPMLLRRQQADGHFSFLDPRGRASKSASVVEGMVAQRPDSVKEGWVIHVDPLGIAQVETGACAVALSTAGQVLGRADWLKASQQAADWAMGQPCLPNFVANAASTSLLARAFLDAEQDRHLVGLARKLTIGLLPGQVENGRWIDASSATTPNHLLILRALHDAWEAIPADRDDLRRELKPAIDLGVSSLLAECKTLGVPTQGSALRDLLRHRDLFHREIDPRLEPAILDSATVIQELCHEGPKPKLGVAPDQLAGLSRI